MLKKRIEMPPFVDDARDMGVPAAIRRRAAFKYLQQEIAKLPDEVLNITVSFSLPQDGLVLDVLLKMFLKRCSELLQAYRKQRPEVTITVETSPPVGPQFEELFSNLRRVEAATMHTAVEPYTSPILDDPNDDPGDMD